MSVFWRGVDLLLLGLVVHNKVLLDHHVLLLLLQHLLLLLGLSLLHSLHLRLLLGVLGREHRLLVRLLLRRTARLHSLHLHALGPGSGRHRGSSGVRRVLGLVRAASCLGRRGTLNRNLRAGVRIKLDPLLLRGRIGRVVIAGVHLLGRAHRSVVHVIHVRPPSTIGPSLRRAPVRAARATPVVLSVVPRRWPVVVGLSVVVEPAGWTVLPLVIRRPGMLVAIVHGWAVLAEVSVLVAVVNRTVLSGGALVSAVLSTGRARRGR